jgi:hypothetical protein
LAIFVALYCNDALLFCIAVTSHYLQNPKPFAAPFNTIMQARFKGRSDAIITRCRALAGIHKGTGRCMWGEHTFAFGPVAEGLQALARSMK